MYNKKVLIDSLKKLGSAKAPARKKDMIIDPRGQWAHPGENTRIPSNNITMANVPYPVYADPNVGPSRMMYPEQEYNFPGADYVDEYPQINSKQLAKKQLGGPPIGLTRFVGSAGRMMGLPPALSHISNIAPKVNALSNNTVHLFTKDIVPGLDQATRDLLRYHSFDVLTGETELGSPTELTKYLGDFDFKSFSDGWEARNAMMNAFDEAQWVPSKDDFFTNKEIENLFNQHLKFRDAARSFDEMYPEDPGMAMFNALTGNTRRDELFSNLYPNVGLPNFRSKILSTEQEKNINLWLNKYSNDVSSPSFINKSKLNSQALKTINAGFETLPGTYKDLLKKSKGANWFSTGPARDVVMEMRGGLGLKLEDLKNATPEQFEKWRQEVVNKAYKQSLERWKKDTETPFKGSDAWREISNQPGYKNKYGGSASRLPRKKNSRGYSRSLEATNKFFAENSFFAKQRSRKNKIYDPNAKYYQDGGEPCPEGYIIYNGQCVEWQEPEVIDTDERTGYNAAMGQINRDTRPGSIENNDWWLEHEKYHHLQNLGGGMSTAGFLGQRPNNTVASDESMQRYYNRRDSDLNDHINSMIKANPELQFMPREKLLQSQFPVEGEQPSFLGAEDSIYQDPSTVEGEARVREEQFKKDGISMFPKKQVGGALKAIAKNSKKILTKKDLDVIKSAAEDFKKYAIRSTDITVPAIKKAQSRLLEAADPKSRTIMSGVELTPDGRLKISSDKKIQGSQGRSFSVLKRYDEERLQAFTEHLKEEADLLKSNAESYLENPYAIDLNRGDSLQFDKDGFLIEPLGGFYHGIGSTSPGFSLENLEFDRSKLDPEVLKGWTSTGNKYGNSKAEYGFFGALNKNQGSQAALKYDGTRERAIMEMLRDPSKRPSNLGAIKEIGLSPNARLVGGKSPYVLNALKELGISFTEMSQGVHIGGQMGMTPQKAAMLRSKYGIDGIIDLGGDELAIFNPDIITGVSDVPFKLFDYTNPLMQSLRQSEYTATDMGNILQNQFGSSYINSNYNQPYIPADHSWAVGGADKLGSMMDNSNAYKAREILQTPSSYFRGGLRIDPYGRPDIFSAGLPFSEKWWKAAEPNLDLIRQKGGPINTSGPRAEEAPVDEDAMNAMMKARLAYEEMHGNPAAKRMVNLPDNPYQFDNGDTGTHYMASMDNYAVPQIQDENGQLMLGDYGPDSREAMRFDSDEDANYFAEHYKDVSPGFIEAKLTQDKIQEYVKGGYIVEEVTDPSIPALNSYAKGGPPPPLSKIVKGVKDIILPATREQRILARAQYERALLDAQQLSGINTNIPTTPQTFITPPNPGTVGKIDIAQISDLKKRLEGLDPSKLDQYFEYPFRIQGKSGMLDMKLDSKEDNRWHFSAFMNDPREAGLAFHYANKMFPYPFPKILEPVSLSLDSFNMLTNMGRRDDWDMEYAGQIMMNNFAKHSKLFDGLDRIPTFITEKKPEDFQEYLDRINNMILEKGLKEKATIDYIPAGDYGYNRFFLPNYRLTRKWSKGGIQKAQGNEPTPPPIKFTELISSLKSLSPGNTLRSTLYRGVNPGSYNIMDKVKSFPSEFYGSSFNNETRPFRVGLSLKYGADEYLDTFLKTKRLSRQEFDKMPDTEKMMLFNEDARNILEDIGRRRLDAWAVGLKQPQEYGTLEQVGDNTFKMKNLDYTPDFFSERYTDIQAQGLKDRDYYFGEENPLVTIAKQHYDRTTHPFIETGLPNNFKEQELLEKYKNAPRSYIDKVLGFPQYEPEPWTQMRHAGMSTINQDPSFKYSVWDNDSYGVMGGYRWDVAKNPEGMHWQANDLWDINPFERRGSAHLKPNETVLKYLHGNYFKPLQNFEALSAVGGKPFNIQNNFLIDPVTFKPLKQWQKGGFLKRKKKKKKPEQMEPIEVLQPGQEAFPLPETPVRDQWYDPIVLKDMTQEELDAYNKAHEEEQGRLKFEADKAAQPSYFDEAKNWVSNWHDSPMYNQMVLNSYNGQQKNADYVTKLRKKNIADLPPLNVRDAEVEVNTGNAPDSSGVAAWSKAGTGQIEVFPVGYNYGPSLFTHEILHSSDRPRELYKYDHPAYNTGLPVKYFDDKNIDLGRSWKLDENDNVVDYPDWILYNDPRFPEDGTTWHDRVMPKSDQMYIATHRSSNWKDNETYKLNKAAGWYTPRTDEKLKKDLIEDGFDPNGPEFNNNFETIKKQDEKDAKYFTKSDKKYWKEFGHDYVSDPSEVRARLGEIRFHAQKEGIYDPFTEQITPEIFQEYINKDRDSKNWQPFKPIKELRHEFTDEEILYMLQHISKNETENDENELQYGKYGGIQKAQGGPPPSLSKIVKGVNALSHIGTPTKSITRSIPLLTEVNSALTVPVINKLIPEINKNILTKSDWAKWNKATPDFSKLMQEYADIEEFTKGTGTWMKNADGTLYKGSPQQFIQEQSSYFKNAFPEGYESVFRGVNRRNSFADFGKGVFLRGDRGIFTANPELAYQYANHHAGTEPMTLNPFVNDNVQGVYELIYPKGKQIIHDAQGADWRNVDILNNTTSNDSFELQRLNDFFRNLQRNENNSLMQNNNQLSSPFPRTLPGPLTTTDMIARYIPQTNLNSILLKNILDGGHGDVTIVNNRSGNYLKSRIGNTGFFKMDTPMIYKSLGGESDYELGDEVDEATMKELEKLGYIFEIVK
jgi:hypothetical protein